MSMTIAPPGPTSAAGVGFDTARYGHHVTFLRADLQPACAPFEFPETRAGYDRVLQLSRALAGPDAALHFHIRLDAAGRYATNLEAFLRALPFPTTITVGEPARNQDYRKALFPRAQGRSRGEPVRGPLRLGGAARGHRRHDLGPLSPPRSRAAPARASAAIHAPGQPIA